MNPWLAVGLWLVAASGWIGFGWLLVEQRRQRLAAPPPCVHEEVTKVGQAPLRPII